MNPLQELRDVDAPGTALTAEGLLRAGRARVRRRRNAMVGTAAAVVLILTVGAAAFAGVVAPQRPADGGPVHPGPDPGTPAVSSCRTDFLPLPGGVDGTGAPVVDSTGHWAAAMTASRTGVVIWQDGAIRSVDGDEQVVFLLGVSAGGTAVGTANVGGRSSAVTFTDRMNVLPLPTGAPATTATYGSGINAAGTVVGYYDSASGGRKPVQWLEGKPLPLAVPGGKNAAALWITDDGWIGGLVGQLYDDYRPYVWRPDGTGFELPLPAGVSKGMVNAIAGEWAVDFDNHVRWRLTLPGTPTPLPFGVAAGVQVRSMARDGAVTLAGSKTASVWGSSGEPRELPLPTGFSKYQMGGISADGRVIGGAAQHLMDNDGGTPFRWVCGA